VTDGQWWFFALLAGALGAASCNACGASPTQPPVINIAPVDGGGVSTCFTTVQMVAPDGTVVGSSVVQSDSGACFKTVRVVGPDGAIIGSAIVNQ